MESANASREVAPERIRAVTASIIRQRQVLDYMTVARAMVLDAEGRGKREAATLARHLGISKQTRHNWLHRDLVDWVAFWEARERAKAEGHPQQVRKRVVYSQADWAWMAQVLARVPARRREREIARAAGRHPEFGHLAKVSRVTLWRNRSRLTELARIRPAGANGGPSAPPDTVAKMLPKMT